ncbi:hypothetical protein [Photorhabdus cinerea]|uniref:Uncharacterized protein n=1 Tax=Photorhabdus cinerea TaxID=471575 RepID=A0A7X5TII9_9GAMM|nr:hypothetical protein [Photorhabdus cinerea]NHB93603.1 hypothetical protein [Photorhabdus cinerea]
MNKKEEQEVRRKLKILAHAEEGNNVSRTYRYWGNPWILFTVGLAETVALAKSAVPSSRKINGKTLSGDVSLSAENVGVYPKSGGVVNGNVDATGYISGKGVYEASSIRVYSSINKPPTGELGAY